MVMHQNDNSIYKTANKNSKRPTEVQQMIRLIIRTMMMAKLLLHDTQ